MKIKKIFYLFPAFLFLVWGMLFFKPELINFAFGFLDPCEGFGCGFGALAAMIFVVPGLALVLIVIAGFFVRRAKRSGTSVENKFSQS